MLTFFYSLMPNPEEKGITLSVELFNFIQNQIKAV